MSISVLILAQNEEETISHCLSSLSWCDDIVILDGFSTDSTSQVAQGFSCRVVRPPEYFSHAPFGGDEAKYRNWALRHIQFKYEWLLVLDADERLPCSTYLSICNILTTTAPNISAFRLPRHDYLDSVHLKHVQASPFYIRLFRHSSAHYDRLINCTLQIDGGISTLDAPFDHYPFSKGISHWIAKHNNYSDCEALHSFYDTRPPLSTLLRGSLTERDFNKRRAFQKQLFSLVPFRPLTRFLILYFFKLGFLDGRAGLKYAILQSIYQYFIELKLSELILAAKT